MVAHITGIYQPFLQIIKFFGQMIILSYGGYRVWAGNLELGHVVAVLMYWDKFMDPTINMGNFSNTLMQAMASAERVFALLDMKPEVRDREGAKPLPRLSGHIVFDHVSFGYDPARPVLHDIHFEIPAGKTYALVGHTGCGKSSTIALLARFYEPQHGCVRVDGFDTREHTLESLHKQMGLVSQVNYLFSGTVLDNIRYARPEATEADVYAAAESLGIHETILSLPLGYQTLVGERGGQISLGIRQLICFARVLIANPSIFLLDEATSSIDVVTEAKVQAALERLVKGRTTVIVAHRLSTIVKADCIVVLDAGKIVEMGNHAQLLEKGGAYSDMYTQFVASQGR
jgi:ATP-binding cassette subfamily B protein